MTEEGKRKRCSGEEEEEGEVAGIRSRGKGFQEEVVVDWWTNKDREEKKGEEEEMESKKVS